MLRALTLGLAVTLLVGACGRSETNAAPELREITRLDIDEIVLSAEEELEGTEFLLERSGTLALDERWPSDCCPGQQVLLEEAGFEPAYASVFEKPGHSGHAIDTRPGWEGVASIVALFETSTGASSALGDWFAYYD